MTVWGPRGTKQSVGGPQKRWFDDIRSVAGKNCQKQRSIEKCRKGFYPIMDEQKMKKKKSNKYCGN